MAEMYITSYVWAMAISPLCWFAAPTHLPSLCRPARDKRLYPTIMQHVAEACQKWLFVRRQQRHFRLDYPSSWKLIRNCDALSHILSPLFAH